MRLAVAAGFFVSAGGASDPPLAAPNDNRTPGNVFRGGAHALTLDARAARWKPDDGADSTLTVQAFATEDGVPRIPGPLLRVRAGDEAVVTVVNSLGGPPLVLHGIVPGSRDSVSVPVGERRELRFTAQVPGTYLYWATSTGSRFADRTRRDAQLTGAIVVDPAGAVPDAAERVFVITMMDMLPDTTKPLAGQDDIFDLAINGKSWPSTERLRSTVGDTVRWRWLNGGQLPHPMHLHGFHFRTLAKGNGRTDTAYAPGTVRLGVTELMRPGSTFAMDFVPTREGRWLFHCHMVPHITPFPSRPDSVRAHAPHADPSAHATMAMSGLVLGIEVAPRAGRRQDDTPSGVSRRLRLIAQEAPTPVKGEPARGFVLQRGADPRPDSVEIPGTPIVLTRGERVAITVVNRLPQQTNVHWHGMELESYYDGVSGWSGADARRTPLVAPGDSFTVTFTPPRAGTFMYHTHMEEEPQLQRGLYGPMIVLEPGQTFDPRRDFVMMLGERPDTNGRTRPMLNGRVEQPPLELPAGITYRFRLINILPADPFHFSLVTSDTVLQWTPRAKDGADLPAALTQVAAAEIILGAGEAYDFTWTPGGQDAELRARPAIPGANPLRVPIRVRR